MVSPARWERRASRRDGQVPRWPSPSRTATGPRPGLSQAPPPNPIAAEPDGRRVLSRGGEADHAV